MTLLYIVLIGLLLPHFTLMCFLWMPFFKRAGYSSFTALIPVYNIFVVNKITGQPKWWLILSFVPFLGIFMAYVWSHELIRSFGKIGSIPFALTLLLGPLYLAYVAFVEKPQYLGKEKTDEIAKRIKEERNILTDWADAALYAVVAATFIRTLLLENYMIPTPSMEKSQLVGDYLVVSKLHYGARIPITPLAVPLVHHTVPGLNIKAYTDMIQLPYFRFPMLESIKRNHPIVFNYPKEDFRPVDKRENYIKRCVALPGDKLQITDQLLFINDSIPESMAIMQYKYIVKTNAAFNITTLQNMEIRSEYSDLGNGYYAFDLTEEKAARLKTFQNVTSIDKQFTPKYEAEKEIFPNSPVDYPWNRDNFGPLTIPAEGMTVELNMKNIVLYKAIIEDYEGHELLLKEGKIYIDKEEATSYTFEMNYYWGMGDNRHNSLDSRYWGFIPENHIVGKPLFVLFSKRDFGSLMSSFRTDRFFKAIE